MTRYIQRYNAKERSNHWAVAILFVLAALSGLAFFHPAFYFFTNLFGGGPWARILHPFIGVVMVLLFLVMFFRYRADNKMTDADREWNKHRGELMRGNKDNMPPVGKYNAGQKMVFWSAAWSLFVLVATGLVFWRPWFAGYFPVDVVRAAALLHSVAAVVLVLSTIVHAYAAFWVKGSLRAMTRGTVSETWAKQNHALWFEEVTRGK
jgi:formate dehydrogenase subunit gamma